ncbi:MAG: 3-deoxy-D-manno-octulosonic acid transferase [Planctomycetota bacterium]
MTILLDLLYGLTVSLIWPYLLYRRWKRGPAVAPLREYFGRVPSRPVAANCVWIHGVSLGEINATRTIVTELRQRAPDTIVVISSTTATGLTRARELYPKHEVFRFPLDFSFAIRTVLARIRPSVIVLMELEAWPNLVAVATRREIPVVIANGRVTAERSIRRFKKPIIRWISRRMFQQIRWVGAQDGNYSSRFIELGVPPERVHVTGSVKYDAAQTTDYVDGQDELAEEMGIDTSQALWVCGSTGPGEEAMALDAQTRLLKDFPNLQLALIPRKPERFDEVASLVAQRGFACLRRSTGCPVMPANVVEPKPVFLGDTMGELRKFYALSVIVFVGRTLVPMGGSDVMEVAGLAKPIIVGPYTENFTEAVNLLLAEGALRRISGPERLAIVVSELLRHPERRTQMGQLGREAILSRRGASRQTVDRILELVS